MGFFWFEQNKNRASGPDFAALLPLLDAFRTVNWKRIKDELEELKVSLGIQLFSVKI